eukprot:Blabericola_migrator_1__3951@NODE_219_length_11213_cov_124_951821_g186_i0_p8_GENE_NODE_219_length_11213_cov_124_951821_g186_i0NODE_219_length_11213_cov_124_951821_g186_i0_p8_ORF_typecomplete_len141_score30_31HIT/PF01230_23/0_057_NODE_219_length_11213_cov_124_951821_g186_i047825204
MSVVRETTNSTWLTPPQALGDGHVVLLPKKEGTLVDVLVSLWLDAQLAERLLAEKYIKDKDRSFTMFCPVVPSGDLTSGGEKLKVDMQREQVHIHVIPRVAGDYVPNDIIYDRLKGVPVRLDDTDEDAKRRAQLIRSALE